MKKVYILDGLRIPNGKKNGIYKTILPETFTADLIEKILEKYNFLTQKTNTLLLGCSLGTGGNMARHILLKTSLNPNVPAYTTDTQCISGFQAIYQGFQLIKSGEADCVLVGGFESTSLAPKRFYHPNDSRYNAEKTFNSAQFFPNQPPDFSMVDSAEHCMKQLEISLEETLNEALESHKRSKEAENNAWLHRYIEPYKSKHDETIRKKSLDELIQQKYPTKLINAYNSADNSDGAAILVLVSEKFKSIANFEIEEIKFIGNDPWLAPIAFIEAINQLKFTIQEVELAEINESFALKPVFFKKKFEVDSAKVNIFGGNLTYGHPFGASSVQNFLHLMAALAYKNKTVGLVAASAAGGLGAAAIVKRIGK